MRLTTTHRPNRSINWRTTRADVETSAAAVLSGRDELLGRRGQH